MKHVNLIDTENWVEEVAPFVTFQVFFSRLLSIYVYNLDVLSKENYVFSFTLFVAKSNFEKHT